MFSKIKGLSFVKKKINCEQYNLLITRGLALKCQLFHIKICNIYIIQEYFLKAAHNLFSVNGVNIQFPFKYDDFQINNISYFDYFFENL